jgi:hypothetical protein
MDIVGYFIKNPKMLTESSGKFLNGKRGPVGLFDGETPESIQEYKRQARKALQKPTQIDDVFLSEKVESDDETVFKFKSTKALTPSEIDELVHVDNINFRRSQTWFKQAADGTFTYSISVMPIMKNFYAKEELRERLKELFPTVKAEKLKLPAKVSEKALIILLSDDHAGAVNTTDLFINNTLKYIDKLQIAAAKITSTTERFEECHIISLGDQLNGWNSLTTRGGHEVKSLSNKEQFDIYVTARKAFYDTIFTSGIAAEYNVHDLENSNHSGLGFSYIANQYLHLYIEMKYPEVNKFSVTELIGGFDYGVHSIMFTHGKDETFMKKPMPLIIDAKTDLFVYQYLCSRGYNPAEREGSFTLYKGDLHQFNIQKAKFGRYVNVPSVIGNSDYSDNNFGDSEAGILVEVLEKDCKDVSSKLLSLEHS